MYKIHVDHTVFPGHYQTHLQQSINNWSFCMAELEFWSFYMSYCQKNIFNPWFTAGNSFLVLWEKLFTFMLGHTHTTPPHLGQKCSHPGSLGGGSNKWILATGSTVYKYHWGSHISYWKGQFLSLLPSHFPISQSWLKGLCFLYPTEPLKSQIYHVFVMCKQMNDLCTRKIQEVPFMCI